MKIYTKTGDKGSTSLFGGSRVGKDSLRICSYGFVDELNSYLGVVISSSKNIFLIKKLSRIQRELMILGSDLASPTNLGLKVPRVNKVFTKRLEKEVDDWEKLLPKLKNFILPGGSPDASRLQFSRSISRRCERSIVELSKSEKINPNILPYINRLSDWFFVLARYINFEDKTDEVIWRGRSG